MTIPKRVLKQLGHPSGFAGRFILRLLNRVNENMNAKALGALSINEESRLLEVGFGGGALISDTLAAHKLARIDGCDISKLAVKTAKRRFRGEPCVRFEQNSGEALPYRDGEFSHLVSVNVIYFWQNQLKMFAEMHRVLERGGRLVLCYSEFGPDEILQFQPSEVEAALRMVGFESTHSKPIATNETDSHFCTVGFKPLISPAE